MVRAVRAGVLTATIHLLCFGSVAGVRAQARADEPGLRIVSAGPTGEVADRTEANEIRVVFSEPMVTLGRIPEKVSAPFFQMTPAAPGTLRWSGTTILIFTPDPRRPLPYATRFDITITTGATSVRGRRLAEPYTFSFRTPTVKLLNTTWYRRGGQAGAQMVVLLRFNQPVRTEAIAAHLRAQFNPHPWTPPTFDPSGRLKSFDPTAHERFQAKVAATRAAASARAAVPLRPTADWDKKQWPPSPDLIVFESVTSVPPESQVRLELDPGTPSPAGRETPGAVQTYTIDVEDAFFINRFDCATACDPDRRNPVEMSSAVKAADFAAAVTAVDVTSGAARDVPKAATPRARESYELDSSPMLTLEDAGYDAQPPARTYEVRIAPTLKSADGQTLGYTWTGVVENWHQRAFTSFGDGHGVWERSGGATLPFYARNFVGATEWAAPVRPADLMATLLTLQGHHFNVVPPGQGTPRRLGGQPDRVLSHGIDLSKSLKDGLGLVWAGIRDGERIPRARSFSDSNAPRERSALVQVTNLGISVKDSPQNTLVLVTRLDSGDPVAGAQVSIVQTDKTVFWRGTTGADGIALAPGGALRDPRRWWEFAFVVVAEKDGDLAYAGSDWTEGIRPWDFGASFSLDESAPMLRGTVFSDRGVYRLGEQVHFKAILRHNTPSGIRLLPAATPVFITLRDSQHRLVDERTVKVNGWSSAEWTVTLPGDGALGSYSVRAVLESEKPKARPPEELRQFEEPGPELDEYLPHTKYVTGSFLVAAYRRPDFRVDVTLTGDNPLAGSQVKGLVSARYLFGASMGARPVKWIFTKSPVGEAPAAVRERFPDERWSFVGWSQHDLRVSGEAARNEARLTPGGDLALTLDTVRDAGVPIRYTLEGDVEDVSRQHIANRSSLVVHPAPWYIGVRRPPYFVDRKSGLKTEVVAVAPDGRAVPGVEVELALTQIQWNSVRRAEGNGFYTWETEEKEVPAGSWKVTSAGEPVPLEIPLPSGGYFRLDATAHETGGRFAVTRTSFYVLGAGYTAWMRYDHNRIDLVPERKTYKPGDTARIMIQSPWEQATALVTTEREGIRSHRQFRLSSTQESISIPITEEDIPNIFVSVLLIRGRTGTPLDTANAPIETAGYWRPVVSDPSDPGKPSFRLGYVELKVEDASKRLTVAVNANKEEYRPANTAKVTIDVKDQRGNGASGEVTLWAVDYGVLSLTSYRTPDVLGSVYVQKALQVTSVDSRQRIISRRVLTPKGETEGGGGGADPGAGTLRKDFRVLAFWLGSVTTDEHGRASVDVKLPESLTTYRIMAVAGDRLSRFGSGSGEVRINKPLTLKPTFPRFLAVGDKASFGAVVTSQSSAPGAAIVTIRSLDPALLLFGGATEQRLEVPAGGSVEARFDAAGRGIGRARVRMTVAMGNETDAFEDVIPVAVLGSPEVVAAYGETSSEAPSANEKLTIPEKVVPAFGGLHVEMSSTAMVGLGEGARYLVEYPYGCAEQRASRAVAMLLAADLGDAFSLPGVDTAKIRPAVQSALRDLERYQCEGGGFAYWPGRCQSVSAYLTSYVLHVFKTAVDLKYDVSPDVRARAYNFLEAELAAPQPENEGWWPAYTAWQAFAVKVLVEGGRVQDSNINRLYSYRDRMPVFALAYLLDGLVAKGEKAGPRATELRRRIGNAVLAEAGSAHVEELSDPYLLWFWNSNVRSTAIVLNTLVRSDTTDRPIREIVRWLMSVRKDGRWGNTQENAHAMLALVAYYRRYESVEPDFQASVTLGKAELARERFHGRSTSSVTTSIPMADVLATGRPGTSQPLTFTREGAGTLFYTTRLRYVADELYQDGLNSGFHVERRYEPFVENGVRPATTTYKAGDLVRVTLTFTLTKERRFVAVTDPLPAGFEALESWFATTAASLAGRQDDQGEVEHDWREWWRRGGFDHVERHDDRVQLFATRLSEGVHEFSYIVRATTAGTFRTAPARAEEMYEPEVFGRTATTIVEVRK